MPFGDWQFWLVTLLALWGLWVMARPFLPRRKVSPDEQAACPNCASGSAASKKKKTPRRVPLTIERRKV